MLCTLLSKCRRRAPCVEEGPVVPEVFRARGLQIGAGDVFLGMDWFLEVPPLVTTRLYHYPNYLLDRALIDSM